MQLLESNSPEFNSFIKEDEAILTGIKQMSNSQLQLNQGDRNGQVNSDDQYEDPKVELYNLTQQILQILG